MPLLLAISAHSLYGLLMSKYQLDLAKTHFQFSIESDWFIVSAEEIKIKKNTKKIIDFLGKNFISLNVRSALDFQYEHPDSHTYAHFRLAWRNCLCRLIHWFSCLLTCRLTTVLRTAEKSVRSFVRPAGRIRSELVAEVYENADILLRFRISSTLIRSNMLSVYSSKKQRLENAVVGEGKWKHELIICPRHNFPPEFVAVFQARFSSCICLLCTEVILLVYTYAKDMCESVGMLPNALSSDLRGQVRSTVWYFETQSSFFDIKVISMYNHAFPPGAVGGSKINAQTTVF